MRSPLSRNKRPSFSAEEILRIHQRLARGVSRREIAKDHGVGMETISRIARGDTYAWVNEEAIAHAQLSEEALAAEIKEMEAKSFTPENLARCGLEEVDGEVRPMVKKEEAKLSDRFLKPSYQPPTGTKRTPEEWAAEDAARAERCRVAEEEQKERNRLREIRLMEEELARK